MREAGWRRKKSEGCCGQDTRTEMSQSPAWILLPEGPCTAVLTTAAANTYFLWSHCMPGTLKWISPLTHHTVGLVSLILKRQRNYGIYEFKWLPKSHSYWMKGWLESRSFEPKGMLFSGDPTLHLWSVDAFLPGTVPFPHAVDKPIKGKWEGQRKNAEFSTGLWLGLGTNSWHSSALCLDTERTNLCLFCCFIKALPPPSLADVWGMVLGVPVEDKAPAQASHKGV